MEKLRAAKPEGPKPGVYLLFLKKRLTYVGRSQNPATRIVAHRRNGRPFDYSVQVECPPEDVDWIERALIEALNPPQNRLGVVTPRPEIGGELAQVIYQTVPRPEPAPDADEAMSVTAARAHAKRYAIHGLFDAAVRSGALVTYAKNPSYPGPGKPRIVTNGDLGEWVAATLAARGNKLARGIG